MPLLVPNASEIILLRYMLNHTAPSNVLLHLYANNITPAEADVLGTYTETAVAGYSAQTLTGTSWTVANVAGVTTGTYAQQTFTFSAAATIYGYYVTDAAAAELLWAERFTAAPITLPSGGGTINVTPTITLE